ncbi:hypothetical protein BDZ85DRAFT_112671 [Elsinoe ampelina]|uniref:Rhodopsin domain-containing protein n=1 Tax=Elsinoe ampelina TaxID=302913 RepID=A0A6A6GDJ1_9PEZI|nr:hypothetical protein BDZ85DRAFT_112671 [Elsinoe ampelina]
MDPTQATVIGVNVGFSILSIATASTRLHRTVAKTKKLQIHDILLLAALVCGVTEAVLQCVATKYGLGLSKQIQPRNLSEHDIDTFFKLYIAFFISYFACNMFVKLSLLAFYRKLAPDNRYNWILYLMAGIAIVFGIGSILSAALSCIPISKVWNSSTPGVCINLEAFYYANGAFMIFNDIILYILPIIIVRGVQLSRARRAAMNLLFGLGFLVVVTSGLRMIAIHNLFSVPLYSLYYNAILLIWCTVENHLALIIICLPAVKAALIAVAPSLASTPSSLWSRILGGRRASQPLRPGAPLDSTELSATQKSGASNKKNNNKSWFTTGGGGGGDETSTYASRASVVASPRSQKGWWGKEERQRGVDEIELRKDVSVQVMEEGMGRGARVSFDRGSLGSSPSMYERKEAA